MDELLAENHKSQDELLVYKADLEMERFQSDTPEQDLVNVAERLAQLGDRIEQASFEERRRALE